MKRVTGIGGIFFKADDPEKMYQWYERHLGIKREADGFGALFHWREAQGGDSKEERPGMTIWSMFPKSTKYFDPSKADFMLNYRVDDLDALVAALKEEGVEILGQDNQEYGKFAWIMDPEGNRIELWEAPRE